MSWFSPSSKLGANTSTIRANLGSYVPCTGMSPVKPALDPDSHGSREILLNVRTVFCGEPGHCGGLVGPEELKSRLKGVFLVQVFPIANMKVTIRLELRL